MGYLPPWKNCVGAVFKLSLNNDLYILGKLDFYWNQNDLLKKYPETYNYWKNILKKCWNNVTKAEKNILNKWHKKKTLHNTDPPQKINRAWIIFKKLDTIPTHCANQEPTLIDFHHWIGYGHTRFLVAQKVLARWCQNAELRMVFVAFLLITTFSIMNMIVSAHTSAVHCWLLLWVQKISRWEDRSFRLSCYRL